MLSFEQALEKLLAAAQPVEETRSLPLTAALGRILAVSQQSTVAVPPLDNSAMDGYAVRVADITAAGICLSVSQRIPAGADAVIMQERCEHGENGVVINHVPHDGENIRRAGEDISVGAEILKAGVKLRPQEIALAASAGLPELPVFRRVRVGVFFTGDELVQPGEPLPPGAIYNSNRYALRALLEGMGCEVRDLGAVADTLEATRDALRRAAADNDLVLTSGGVSVGEAFGEIHTADGKAWFLGLPGNPVAAFVTFLTMVRPFILRLQGAGSVSPRVLSLPSASVWSRADGARLEFLRGRINDDGAFELYKSQGSAVVISLCWSDGLALNPPGNTIAIGDTVSFVSFAELLS